MSFSPALYKPSLSQYVEMLRRARHRLAGLCSQVFYGTFGLRQKLPQFKTAAAG